MFQNQIQRVRDNLLPFAIIGLLIGIIIGKASWFRSFGWISEYLRYAGINTRYPDSGQIIFLNHFDANYFRWIGVGILLKGSGTGGPTAPSCGAC